MDTSVPLTKSQQTVAKVFAVILGIVGLVIGGLGLIAAGPFLVGLVATTIGALATAGVAVGLGTILFSKWFANLRKTIVVMASLAAWRIVYGYSPTTAMEAIVEQMSDLFNEADGLFKESGRKRHALEEQIRVRQSELEEALTRLSVADANDDTVQVNIESAKVNTRQTAIEEMSRIAADLEAAQEVVGEHRDHARMVLETTKDKVAVLIESHSAAVAAGSSLEMCLQLIDSNGELKRQLDGPMGLLQREMAESLGSIRMAMEDTSGTLKAIQLGDSVARQKASVQLAQWRERNGIAAPEGKPGKKTTVTTAASNDDTKRRGGTLAAALEQRKKTL